jgi:hypothetical protein
MRFEGDALLRKAGFTVRVGAANPAARGRESAMLCYTVRERRLLAVGGTSPTTADVSFRENRTLRRRVHDPRGYAVQDSMRRNDSCKRHACGFYVVGVQVRHAE